MDMFVNFHNINKPIVKPYKNQSAYVNISKIIIFSNKFIYRYICSLAVDFVVVTS